MAKVDDARAGCDRFRKDIHQVLHVGRRRDERHLLQHDPLTAHALVPRREHAAVVLQRGQHLVPRLEIDPELAVLQGLAGVPGDGHLFGITPEVVGQAPPNPFDLGLENPPHGVDRRLIRELHVSA